MADIGQIAYEAYAAALEGSHMLAWDKLPDRIKDAWRVAANELLRLTR